SPEESPELHDPEEEFARLLRHRDVQILVAAEQLFEDLQKPNPPDEDFLSRYFPRKLIQETATLLQEDVDALTQLLDFLDRPLKNYSLLVSLLHAAKIELVPEFTLNPVLKFAYLDQIQWSGVNLSTGDLSHADFRKACLALANLDQVDAQNINFRGAVLTGSSMINGKFRNADFSKANCSGVDARGSLFPEAELEGANFNRAKLRNAHFTSTNLKNTILTEANLEEAIFKEVDLENAQFVRANLSLVTLQNANLENADFSDANLAGSDLNGLCFRGACFDGANFEHAYLTGCDFEEWQCRNINFNDAVLKLALMTGSQMTNVSFQGANLQGARLADISWEGVCLRGADLRGVTFHMGSSRSGLLFTGLASEGTRTGFYTDDYEEQSFRSPEEIRKANLCGADLRGALLDKVDFYLVDLRGAIYDPAQADHFRRCGAIL
ncbi:MAG: pentapeptide repeat-containing protein, partial [Planctomycetaceae bacterium]|nr:pentapeptide repeat-containing protein [Planctomycetaceae bacterium]